MSRGRHPARIHITPPDTAVEERYLVRWYGRDLHHELDRFPTLTSPELFGNKRPLEIDFGCGTATLICSRAKMLPEVNFLGIDNSQKPLYCAIQTAQDHNLGNIKFIRGNFMAMLPLLHDDTISAAYYLLPNPPRDYHLDRANARRRRFLQSIYHALVPSARFYFATDSAVLFACAKNILTDELHYPVCEYEHSHPEFVTHYWKIWEQHGRRVHCLVVEKST